MKILRWTDYAVLWEGEAGSLGAAVIAAIEAGANLTDADLTDADLTGANLTRANLTDADLTGANLTRANLTGANLTDADLTDADLTGANLTDADLTGANLTRVRDDVWAVLSSAPAEARGLLLAIEEGRINGSTYSGECACLVGTIANVRGVEYNAMPTLLPNSGRPAEVWFLGIAQGDKPDSNPRSALAAQWVREWIDAMTAAFATATA